VVRIVRARSARTLSFAALAFVAMLVAGVAHAQVEAEVAPTTAEAPTPAAEAQALFRRGIELGAMDRWAEALELFRRSRALMPRPSTVFNIGFALFRLGHFGEAIASFDEYLALTESETSDLRTEASRRRTEALASLAALTLELTPDDARVLVDGELRDGAGSPRTLTLDPGRHVLRASAEGYEEGTLEISVLAAEQATRQLSLVPTVVVPDPDERIVEPPRPGTSLLEDPIFWVIAGVLVVGAAVGVGVGVSAATTAPPPYGGSTGVVLTSF
jgi:tetratricopeptide (TPR) repeat protein